MTACTASLNIPSAMDVYNNLRTNAEEAVENANEALDELSSFIDTLNNSEFNTGVVFDAPTASGVIPPLKQIEGDVDAPNIEKPTDIGDLNCFIPTTIGAPPVDDIGTVPELSYGTKPGDLDATAPDEPTIDYDVIDVTVPAYTEPSLDTLYDLTIPSEPDIDWPTLDLDEFTWVGPDYPDYEFNWTEQWYDLTLADATQTKLLDWIQNGGTGLHADIESQIWDRARSREDQNSFRVRKKLTIENPASGWAYPTGSLYESILAAEQEAQNKIADLSREIAIKQAELEQSNMHFAIENAIKFESMMIAYYNAINDRALKAQEIAAELIVKVYQTYIERFKAEVAKYQAEASVYAEQIRAELGKVEVFKAQIDAQKVLGEINQQLIQKYIAQWDAVKTQAEIFRIEVEYNKALLEAEALKAEVYKATVQGYAEKVRAYLAEWQAYTEEVKAEVSKVEAYGVKADVFAKRMQGWAAQGNIYVEQDKLKIANIEIFMKKYQAYVDAFKSWNDAQIAYYNGQVGYYRAQAEQAKAEAQTNEAIGKQQFANTLALQEEVKWETDREFAQQSQNLSRLIEINKMVGDTAKALATITAQLATASYSAINFGMNSQLSASTNFNCNESHDYQEK